MTRPPSSEPGREAAAASRGGPAPAPTWWDGVAQRYRRSRLSRVALAVAKLFFVMAALAPLLSHRAPLVWRSSQGLEFPVFAEFTAQDVFWLALAGTFVAARLVGAIVRRRLRDRPEAWHRARRVITAGAAASFLVIAAGGLAIPRSIHPDRWSSLEPGPGEWAIWTPVRHDPCADFDLDHLDVDLWFLRQRDCQLVGG